MSSAPTGGQYSDSRPLSFAYQLIAALRAGKGRDERGTTCRALACSPGR
jgi:hypothetical protein